MTYGTISMRKAVPIPKVRLRLASFSDYAEIAALEQRNGLQPRSREAWIHLWLGNPCYRELGEHWPIGWVLEAHDGSIVGALTNVPQPFEFRGRKLVGAASRGWSVDREHRGFDGLKLLLSLFSQRTADLLLSTSANEATGLAFSRLGAVRVPTGNWSMAATWVGDPNGLASSWLRWKGLRVSRTLAVLAGLPLHAISLCRYFSAKSRGVTVEFAPSFDERFDSFWEELRAAGPDRLLAVRTAAMLRWHFQPALDAGRAWLLTASASERLLAYAVFVRNDNPEIGLRRMLLADFRAVEDSHDLVQLVMNTVLARCLQAHIQIVEAIGCHPGGPLWQLAHYHRQLPSWLYHYKARDPQLAFALRQAQAWDPSCYDGDVTL